MHDDEYGRYITKNGYIDLSLKENLALKVLLSNKGRIVKYDELSLVIYKAHTDYYYECGIRVFIHKLRIKLKGELEIRTKRGIGYYIS